MGSKVNGPGDLKPGDSVMVQHKDGTRSEGVVVSLREKSATIRFGDKVKSVNYFLKVRERGGFHNHQRDVWRNAIEIITPFERWYQRRPSEIIGVKFSFGNTVTLDLRELTTRAAAEGDAIAHLLAIFNWYRSKPAEE